MHSWPDGRTAWNERISFFAINIVTANVKCITYTSWTSRIADKDPNKLTYIIYTERKISKEWKTYLLRCVFYLNLNFFTCLWVTFDLLLICVFICKHFAVLKRVRIDRSKKSSDLYVKSDLLIFKVVTLPHKQLSCLALTDPSYLLLFSSFRAHLRKSFI